MSRRVLTPDVRDHLSRSLRRKLAFVLRATEVTKEKGMFVGHRKLTAPHVTPLLGPRYARLFALLGMRLGEYLEWKFALEDKHPGPCIKSALLFTKACPFVVWWKPPEEVFVEPAPWGDRTFQDHPEEGPPGFDFRHIDFRHFDHHGLPASAIVIPYRYQHPERHGKIKLGPRGLTTSASKRNIARIWIVWIAMLRRLSDEFDWARECEFAPPATSEALTECEDAVSVKLPDDLRSFLAESNGMFARGTALIWPTERIIEENRSFRSESEFRDLYMPFDHLLFFGDSGGLSQFAYAILNGKIRNTHIFEWDHETDSRTNVALDLRMFLERWLAGSL